MPLFSINSTFLGVVGRPVQYIGLDRKILLENVIKEVKVTKLAPNQNFSDLVLINETVTGGELIKYSDKLSARSSTNIIDGIIIFNILRILWEITQN